MQKKYKILIVLGLCVFIIVPVSWYFRQSIKRKFTYFFGKFYPVQNESCHCNWNSMTLHKDSYKYKHLPNAVNASENLFIQNNKQLDNQLKAGRLVAIENKMGYKIRNLMNSSKNLTPKAYEILIEMGRRFQEKLKDTKNENDYFEITSVLRTEEQQKIIRLKYPNAATQGNSTHSYGVSFDIAYIESKKCKLSIKALEEVLSEMQHEEKILLCPEKKCIHITIL